MIPLWSFKWLPIFCTLFMQFSYAWMNQRPVLDVRDGNLFITSAKDRNITLQTIGTSSVNVNGIDILRVSTSARDASQLVERWRSGALTDIENTLTRLTEAIEGQTGLLMRVNALEFGTGPNSTTLRPSRNPNRRQNAGIDALARTRIQRLTARVRQTEQQISSLLRRLETNECASNPCQNGGTCDDMIDGYKCRCTEGWEGPLCNMDINECARYQGTDLGCMNGATCQNLPGTYQCTCKQGWYGIHCTEQLNNCTLQSSHELCGRYGTCVNRPNAVPSYTCICDQGWEADGTNPACTKDVDECAGKYPPCSVNPMVPCINDPGTFHCGPCPQGYTGNGHYCVDIDECVVNNGGCSVSPMVECINTVGSRKCAACPPGYQGDGVTCTYVGSCNINNGGCHPLATCTNTPGMSDWFVQCRCPSGYQGDGVGPNGCAVDPNAGVSACRSNPCHHGSCISHGAYDYTCRCVAGYTGKNCDRQTNPCDPNPCKNGGTCSVSGRGRAVCQCTSGFSGAQCQRHRASCGEIRNEREGRLQFPEAGQNYPDGLSCAWILSTNRSMVLNLTFTAFNLELSRDCQYDFVQLHDGPSAGEQLIGRYCGNKLPHGGNIISSEHAVYLWFHSDNSINRDGFTLEWNSIPPLCGGEINADHGSISSPGSPGRYPKNRDCVWHISVTPGKRIQFHFFTMMLEEHPTCANDYLEIKDGPSLSDRQLGIFCNHTHPAPLITTEDEIWLHFHSDGAGQDFGFQLTFSSIEGSPGCGGVFTANSGHITSPNFHNDAYESLLDCEWRIQIPMGERIQITWMSFELESSRSCGFDSVEVYDGSNREAPLIGRYCGTLPPPTILSTSNLLLIRFKSDWALSSKGFQLNYEVWCGGEFTEETGVIKSPYYPQPYPSARTCIYKVIQPPGKAIELTFQDMDIEGLDFPNCYFDYLEIHDGDNENSTSIGTYCGTNSSIPEFPILSTHNYLWLKFVTDFSMQKRGFMATYTTVERRCGGILKERSGIIQTPNEDGRYRNEEECTWIIQAPPGFVIQLNWLTFDLESSGGNCWYDYIKISENLTATSQQDLGTYCGATKPPTMTSQSQMMSIKFHTDSSLTREGFMASYIFVDASRICGGHFSTLTGVIKSPNYPAYYPANRECEWFISAPNKHQVVLNVKKFEIEQQSNCIFDYLEIRNGGSATSPLLGKFCGTDIPKQLKSFGSEMYIKFKADVSGSGDGFEIEWDSNTIGCGGTLTSTSGSISSPNYPQPYGHRAECNWRIKVSAGSFIQFVIVDLDLEEHDRCSFDFVEVWDGLVSRGTKVGTYCGQDHPLHINTSSNIASIRFRTDWSGSGRGFHINYQAQCHKKLHSFRGVIESPNFPNNYPDRVNCSWTIDAPIGNKLNLTFSHFDLESGIEDSCAYDHLKIDEGSEDHPTRAIGTYCGSDVLPHKIVSTEHQVFVQFFSDAWLANNGFRLEWVVNGCGGPLTHPEGTITSPGYPNAYTTDIECEWNIEVDFMHSIEITLEEVKLEKIQDCPFDSLIIYSGPDEHAPQLIKTCYIDKPVVLTSSSNKLLVKFKSDFSRRGKGFNATYKSTDLKCGGRFTAATGLIHSPNYPSNYPKNQYCEWQIQVAANHLVNLTFVDFDIEDTANCTDDYVKIYDGSSSDAPLLGSHCHNLLPPSYISTSNELLVVMRSDSYIPAKGFKATYDLACGARIVTNDQGIISMDSAVGLHTDIMNCTWIIVAQELEDHVTLTLTDLQLSVMNFGYDDCFDSSVQVFAGEGTDGPSLGTWCNTTVPPPITSQGNALTIHVSAEYGGLYSVKFSGTYSVLNSACGGNYTSEHGTIATPGYPDSYPRNIECIWTLRTTPGSAISLNFREFDLIQSDNCDLDYVEVREGNGAGKLIGVYCGDNMNQITSFKSLWVKFKSSADGTRKGFVADYSLKHGNELSGPTGEIASPLYPSPCILEGKYYWRITVDPGSLVQITFKDFYLENYGDECYIYITIYDGYNEDAPELMTKCGVLLPEMVRSSSNVVYIKFNTNALRYGSWFLLSWLQIPKVSGSGETHVSNTACDEIVSLNGPNNSSYTFHSPGWPNGYEDNLDCNWIFESVPGTHLILKFHNLELEESMSCIMDQVKVFSGNSLTSHREWSELGSFCYSNSTLRKIEASNLMKVNFHTDYAFNKSGFNATVSKVCGGQLYRPNGVIEFNSTTNTSRSGSWSSVICQWNVTVKPGRMIEVKFLSLDIESTSELACSDNYLMLKNGGSASSPLLGTGKYCHNEIPDTLQTTGNQLYVKVSGRKSTTRFKLTYREVGMNCGSEVVLTEDLTSWVINTPNYPNIPSPHSECFWTIMAPAEEKISIHFMERFDLTRSSQCSTEYLEIRDGGTESARLMGRYCGDHSPSSMHTTGNVMHLHFYTEVHDPKNGFKAVVSIGEHCGGIIRAVKGLIHSPNYPASYPKNMSCGWYIVGPPDHTLKLEFQDINLPTRFRCRTGDYVEISERIPSNDTGDGPLIDLETGAQSIGKYCGTIKPGVIETSGNEAGVVFSSDTRSSPNYRGFSINFTSSAEACGGTLDGISGEFTSPGYPNIRSSNHRYCDWRITAPEGYRIQIDILDLALGEVEASDSRRVSPRIVFYNDNNYFSGIKQVNSSTTERQLLSTSNTMRIWYWSGLSTQRGFKARYSRVAPSLCGSVLTNDQGTLLSDQSPLFNLTTFHCNWKAQNPSMNLTSQTLAVTVSGGVGEPPTATTIGSCKYRSTSISVSADAETISCISGNLTEEVILRSPSPVITITALKGIWADKKSRVQFTLKYRWNQCGGILGGPSNVISAPTNLQYPIDCVWHAKFPDNGEVIVLTFRKLNLASCSGNYIIVRNGGPMSPQIDKYCGSIIPANIISQSNQLWIEYHAENQNNEFELELHSRQGGCGGIIQGLRTSEISSPGFPKQYPKNAECLWEIVVDTGYHIGLEFVDRFNLETSSDCSNDYIQIFDWKEDTAGTSSWFSLGKICGRNTPNPFNSTGNRMKILFRSNAAIEADGFHAIWNENCGGIIEVSKETRYLTSPGWPLGYRLNLFCNYTFLAPGKSLIVEFIEFNLEPISGQCRWDNVTIISENEDGTSVWCEDDRPPMQRVESRLELIFKTDRYIQRKGFQIKYHLDECGGEITGPADIKSPSLDETGEYYPRINCTWIVRAPPGKAIVLRFESFHLEYSTRCYFDFVAVYSGLTTLDEGKRLALLCGNLNGSRQALRAENGTMTINFVTDHSFNFGGFEAKIVFTPGEAEGCGGKIQLSGSQTFRTQRGAMYGELLDCHWLIRAQRSEIIKLEINSLDLKNTASSSGPNQAQPCSGDYLEIRDGEGPFSELIGQYCGNIIPPPIISSTNALWIRLVTDGTLNGNGVTGTLTTLQSPCGESLLTVGNQTNVLTSKDYPSRYPPGLRCRWLLTHSDQTERWRRFTIHFIHFDLEDSMNCTKDVLSISDKNSRNYITEGLGQDLIFSGTHDRPSSIWRNIAMPQGSYMYCGGGTPHDYHSAGLELEIQFKSSQNSNGQHAGFKLEYSLSICNRNFTDVQGRILHEDSTNCSFTITARAGYTISLYFNEFMTFDHTNCLNDVLEIFDGDFSNRSLARLCGMTIPNPVFSSGNKLSLRSWSRTAHVLETYDITYTTTDKGRGCGGKLFNYEGQFSSPMYPGPYRNASECIWEVTVPTGFVVTLQFKVFDLGTRQSCETNFLQINDVLPNGDTLSSTTYCGEDEPATYHASNGKVIVTYHTSMNNAGTGWRIAFAAQRHE